MREWRARAELNMRAYGCSCSKEPQLIRGRPTRLAECFEPACALNETARRGNLRLRRMTAERRIEAQFESMPMSDLAAMLSAMLPNMVRRTHRIRLAFTF